MVQGSGLSAHQSVIPRFRFPTGSQCGIYNLPVLNLLRPGDELYITEGCSDCWAMLSAGHKAIAIPSATLLSQKDIEQLSIINSQLSISYHMFPDRDAPGTCFPIATPQASDSSCNSKKCCPRSSITNYHPTAKTSAKSI